MTISIKLDMFFVTYSAPLISVWMTLLNSFFDMNVDMMHLTDSVYKLLVSCRFLLDRIGYFKLANSWRLT